jgi:putative oxidoreductase
MAWATTLLELLGGVSVMLGAFVAPLSLPLVMLTAMLGVHLPYGFSSVRLQAIAPSGAVFGPVGYELNLLYIDQRPARGLSSPREGAGAATRRRRPARGAPGSERDAPAELQQRFRRA